MKKMTINYITNLSLSEISGGWSGINYRLYHELLKYFEINYVGPINPRSDLLSKFPSKIKRILGWKGDFHFFSERRFNVIRKEVEQQLKCADYNFFFGQTPWIKCIFDTPFGVYLDAGFRTYINIYHRSEEFNPLDLLRIEKQERLWLNQAKHIFWGSSWALNQAYPTGYDPKRMSIIHVGGNIPIPKEDKYRGELLFVFISLNFERKGGFVCVKAFQEIKKQYPNAELAIIGQKPPNEILDLPGVVYAGFLDKNNPDDLNKLQNILQRAFFLVHPTTMDTMGAVIIEAGYYGCPTIAPISFGIPELILDRRSGILMEIPFDEKVIVDLLLKYIRDEQLYMELRSTVRTFTIDNLSWEAIGEKVKEKIERR